MLLNLMCTDVAEELGGGVVHFYRKVIFMLWAFVRARPLLTIRFNVIRGKCEILMPVVKIVNSVDFICKRY